jgi:hydrogenase maturation protease
MKTLIMGMGNPILRDDGVGIRIAEELRGRLRDPRICVKEADIYGFGLLELMFGFDRVIVIDAIRTKGGKPGDFYRLTDEDLKFCAYLSSPHDINFATALEMGRRLDLRVPREIVIYAVEGEDLTTFGEDLTPAVERAVPVVVEAILRDEFGRSGRGPGESGHGPGESGPIEPQRLKNGRIGPEPGENHDTEGALGKSARTGAGSQPMIREAFRETFFPMRSRR